MIDVQRGRGHWTVNFNGTQSFTNMLSISLAYKLWELLLDLDCLAQTSSIKNFGDSFLVHYIENIGYFY